MLSSLKPALVIAAASMLTASPLEPKAAMTQWQDLGGGQARVVATLDPATGVIAGMIEVQLEPGWKTYWRTPGQSGIPPEFDFSGSENVALEEIAFPAPEFIEIPESSLIGYKKSARFVFGGMANGRPVSLNMNLLIGICDEICIPATASFDLGDTELAQPDLRAATEIALAKAELPKAGGEEGTPTVSAAIDHDQLTIEILFSSETEDTALFVEGPSDWYIEQPRLSARSEKSAVFQTVLPDAVLDGSTPLPDLRYTLVTSRGDYEGLLDLSNSRR